MDLVYLVSQEPADENIELRYSIRSMVKHLKGFGRIFVVGHLPGFLKDVIHIPAKDPHENNRARNIYEKILLACDHPDVSEDFICASDDHFLLTDHDVHFFPFYHCESLKETFQLLGKDNYYKLHIEATIKALEERQLSTINFNIHSPIKYNKHLFKKIMTSFDWSVPRGYVSKSLYCNSLGITGEYLADNKIHQPFTKTGIYRRISGTKMFSTNEHSVNTEMREVFQELYPISSAFES